MFAENTDMFRERGRSYQLFTSSNSFDPFGLDSFRFTADELSNGLITTDSKPLISPRQKGHNGGGLALF